MWICEYKQESFECEKQKLLLCDKINNYKKMSVFDVNGFLNFFDFKKKSRN